MAEENSTHGSQVSNAMTYVLNTLSQIIFGDQQDESFDREVRVLLGRPLSSADTSLVVEALVTEAALLRQEMASLNPSAVPTAKEDKIIARM